ncbi:hypothetical protein FP2506_11537 [Fulvimarina pelagi HTCC2506]|uniref:Uncharacterized protein n=1 Tax=Fulvimarina pelagi HTCC2506 TaxID=314231 RepID=Q0FYX2_9HYPH|nr:hypothetical protein [Fulvimarina pelagi]EAU40186.1 hypothetical protein FP2506_11537 [Fulvimarina pelagi HTCC2506]
MTEMVITAVLRVGPGTSAQQVADWLESESKCAGYPIRVAQVLPYDPPRAVDPSATDLGDPEG